MTLFNSHSLSFITLFFFTIIGTAYANEHTNSNYTIRKDVMGDGGGYASSSANYQVFSSIGLLATAKKTLPNYGLSAGFFHPNMFGTSLLENSKRLGNRSDADIISQETGSNGRN